MLARFVHDTRGGSSAEYALILAMVGVAIGAGALVLARNTSYSVEQAADIVTASADSFSSGSGDD